MEDKKIPVTEIFYSLQGEGLYTGTPSIFVRLFGCNFRCQGFGMPKGELSNEYKKINPDDYTHLSQLPLVQRGCDSYPAWDPRFKHMQRHLTAKEIANEVYEIGRKYEVFPHVIFTGGEPLLRGQQKNIINILDELIANNYGRTLEITFETNGTQKLTNDLSCFLSDNYECLKTTFSVSAKLSSSGEKRAAAIKPESVVTYFPVAYNVFFKFVVSNAPDFEEVKEVLKIYQNYLHENDYYPPFQPYSYRVYCGDYNVYIMPAGGTGELYNLNERWVADKCLEYGYRFSQRLQVLLYKNEWAT